MFSRRSSRCTLFLICASVSCLCQIMSIEDVERILDETQESIEYQRVMPASCQTREHVQNFANLYNNNGQKLTTVLCWQWNDANIIYFFIWQTWHLQAAIVFTRFLNIQPDTFGIFWQEMFYGFENCTTSLFNDVNHRRRAQQNWKRLRVRAYT